MNRIWGNILYIVINGSFLGTQASCLHRTMKRYFIVRCGRDTRVPTQNQFVTVQGMAILFVGFGS
jgi:hypothetical protein